MQRYIKPLAALTVVLVAALLSYGYLYAAFNTEPTHSPVPTVSSEAQKPPTPMELLKLVNEERAKVGVAPLTMREELNGSAQLKADDMLKRNYYAHSDPDGKHGYMYAYEALPAECRLPSENMTGSLDAKSAIEGWMNSESHRRALLDKKYTITGFGIANDLIVEHFC